MPLAGSAVRAAQRDDSAKHQIRSIPLAGGAVLFNLDETVEWLGNEARR
jgi:hypothetical protein